MVCIHLQVLSFIVLICASVVTGAINDIEDLEDVPYENSGRYRSAAGWLIFVAVMGIIIETIIIIIRFLNIIYINQNFIIFGVIVSQLYFYKECVNVTCFTDLIM